MSVGISSPNSCQLSDSPSFDIERVPKRRSQMERVIFPTLEPDRVPARRSAPRSREMRRLEIQDRDRAGSWSAFFRSENSVLNCRLRALGLFLLDFSRNVRPHEAIALGGIASTEPGSRGTRSGSRR